MKDAKDMLYCTVSHNEVNACYSYFHAPGLLASFPLRDREHANYLEQ